MNTLIQPAEGWWKCPRQCAAVLAATKLNGCCHSIIWLLLARSWALPQQPECSDVTDRTMAGFLPYEKAQVRRSRQELVTRRILLYVGSHLGVNPELDEWQGYDPELRAKIASGFAHMRAKYEAPKVSESVQWSEGEGEERDARGAKKLPKAHGEPEARGAKKLPREQDGSDESGDQERDRELFGNPWGAFSSPLGSQKAPEEGTFREEKKEDVRTYAPGDSAQVEEKVREDRGPAVTITNTPRGGQEQPENDPHAWLVRSSIAWLTDQGWSEEEAVGALAAVRDNIARGVAIPGEELIDPERWCNAVDAVNQAIANGLHFDNKPGALHAAYVRETFKPKRPGWLWRRFRESRAGTKPTPKDQRATKPDSLCVRSRKAAETWWLELGYKSREQLFAACEPADTALLKPILHIPSWSEDRQQLLQITEAAWAIRRAASKASSGDLQAWYAPSALKEWIRQSRSTREEKAHASNP